MQQNAADVRAALGGVCHGHLHGRLALAFQGLHSCRGFFAALQRRLQDVYGITASQLGIIFCVAGTSMIVFQVQYIPVSFQHHPWFSSSPRLVRALW